MIENRDSAEQYPEENENSTWIVTYADLMMLVPNDSAENRAINRRVEFVLEKKE